MSNELREAIKTVLEGFERGMLIRNTSEDYLPGWAIKMLPYISALSKLAKAVEERR